MHWTGRQEVILQGKAKTLLCCQILSGKLLSFDCPSVPCPNLFKAHLMSFQLALKAVLAFRLPTLPKQPPPSSATTPPPPLSLSEELEQEAQEDTRTVNEQQQEKRQQDADAKIKLLEQLRERRREVEQLMVKRRAERDGISMKVMFYPGLLSAEASRLLLALSASSLCHTCPSSSATKFSETCLGLQTRALLDARSQQERPCTPALSF